MPDSAQDRDVDTATTPDRSYDFERMRRLGDPVVSVVVANHNYGHFLSTCLDSVLAQTRPPEEIIVVDDGSTDGSCAVLEAFRGRVEIIATGNGGQAAALNRGFAASRGDLVLFLDADDALKPECIETVLLGWHDDLAVLTFGLELVDEAGRSLGVHEASRAARPGDNRPSLLATGTFAFPPTSGNVFSRWALEKALPMPEARWRISADCYLIRAAALLGRAGAISGVLGEYRLHGSNNYARSVPGLRDGAQRRSDLSDIADALDDLAAADGLRPTDAEEADGLAVALRARAAALRAEARGDMPDRWPPVPEALLLPRWPAHLPFGKVCDVTREDAHSAAAVPSTDWLRHGPTSAPRALRFSVDPTRGPLVVTVELVVDSEFVDPPTDPGTIWPRSFYSKIHSGDEIVWSGFARSGAWISFPVAASPWEGRRIVDLRLKSRGGLAFRSIRVTPLGEFAAAPRLPSGGIAGLSFDDWPGLDPDEWAETVEGIALVGAAATLRFSADPGHSEEIVLGIGETTPRGHLRIMAGDHRVFAGTVRGRSRLVLTVPSRDRSRETMQALEFSFLPYDDDGRLELVEIGCGDRCRRKGSAPLLNAGELVDFASAAHGRSLLADGWFLESGEGARNERAEAEIAFCVPQGMGGGLLRLTVRPLLPPPAGARHVVGVSIAGEMRAMIDLEGQGDCEIQLPAVPPDEPVAVGVHSIFVSASESDEAPGLAPIELTHVFLDATPCDPPPTHLRAARTRTPPFETAMKALGKQLALSEEEPVDPERLAPFREQLLEMIADGDAGFLLLVSVSRHGLSRLADLNARLGSGAPTQSETRSLARIAEREDGSDVWRLRAALADMLTVPAFRSIHFADPGKLPAPLYWRAEATASYICQPPVIVGPEDHADYAAWLRGLYAALDDCIAREPETSAVFRICADVLSRLRAVRVIFGDGCLTPLLRGRSRAIERLLARQGGRLPWSPPERTEAARIRVGVLVRDVLPNPEGWALLGMWAGLDHDTFEPILIRMTSSAGSLETGGRFARELDLGGLPVEAAVAEIRDLDLNVFVTGCYAFDYERVSSILAHRLARVQVWHGAVCPSTGAFRSFDIALTNRETEPVDAQAHYTETVAWIDGPAQCAYDFTGVRPDGRAHMRAELGVPGDAVLLVSGAMAHKITDPLLDAWAEILAGAPGAVLVLYPFAENWSMEFEAAAFLDRVSRALRRRGVEESRVVVLPTQTPARVSALAGAADLYLDSFPYSGATTVCEALARGTPVLTRAGGALRQLTGASWVRAFGEAAFVAASAGDYVATAVELVNDPERLREARERLEARVTQGEPPHCATVPFGREFGAALSRLAGAEPSMPRGEAPARRPVAQRSIIKFGIFASHRTGSMFLCHLLNLTPGVLCHYELFHDDMIQYRDGDVTDADAVAARNAEPTAFLRRTIEEARREGWRAFGFKQLGHMSHEVTEEMVGDREMRLIRLVRSNLLAQYSSERMAQKTDDWMRRKGAERRSTKITFDVVDFEDWEARQRLFTQTWAELLARSGREALFLDYTRLFHRDTPKELSAYLGFRVRDPEDVDLLRQNDDDILSRFDDPDAVRAYLDERGLSHWAWGG